MPLRLLAIQTNLFQWYALKLVATEEKKKVLFRAQISNRMLHEMTLYIGYSLELSLIKV